jgi:accessory gene regulator protein AgrB
VKLVGLDKYAMKYSAIISLLIFWIVIWGFITYYCIMDAYARGSGMQSVIGCTILESILIITLTAVISRIEGDD